MFCAESKYHQIYIQTVEQVKNHYLRIQFNNKHIIMAVLGKKVW